MAKLGRDYFDLSPADRINRWFSTHKTNSDQFDTRLWTSGELKLISAERLGPTQAKAVFEFSNSKHWQNGYGTLHGGVHAVLHDMCTSMAIAVLSRPAYWVTTGVSRSLSTTYLRPATSGEAMVIEAEVVHIGKRLALVVGTIRRKSDSAIVSLCEHNKANNDPAPKL